MLKIKNQWSLFFTSNEFKLFCWLRSIVNSNGESLASIDLANNHLKFLAKVNDNKRYIRTLLIDMIEKNINIEICGDKYSDSFYVRDIANSDIKNEYWWLEDQLVYNLKPLELHLYGIFSSWKTKDKRFSYSTLVGYTKSNQKTIDKAIIRLEELGLITKESGEYYKTDSGKIMQLENKYIIEEEMNIDNVACEEIANVIDDDTKREIKIDIDEFVCFGKKYDVDDIMYRLNYNIKNGEKVYLQEVDYIYYMLYGNTDERIIKNIVDAKLSGLEKSSSQWAKGNFTKMKNAYKSYLEGQGKNALIDMAKKEPIFIDVNGLGLRFNEVVDWINIDSYMYRSPEDGGVRTVNIKYEYNGEYDHQGHLTNAEDRKALGERVIDRFREMQQTREWENIE